MFRNIHKRLSWTMQTSVAITAVIGLLFLLVLSFNNTSWHMLINESMQTLTSIRDAHTAMLQAQFWTEQKSIPHDTQGPTPDPDQYFDIAVASLNDALVSHHKNHTLVFHSTNKQLIGQLSDIQESIRAIQYLAQNAATDGTVELGQGRTISTKTLFSPLHDQLQAVEGVVLAHIRSSRIAADRLFLVILFLCVTGLLTTVLWQIRIGIRQKKAEDESLEHQVMLQRVLDTIPVRVFWKSTDLTFLGCNRLFARDAGFDSHEELLGKDDYQMGWAEQARLYRNDDLAVMNSGQPKLNYEEPQTSPTGESLWLRTSKIPLLDRDKKVIGILGTYEDITAQKKAALELKQRTDELQALIDALPDTMIKINAEGRMVDVRSNDPKMRNKISFLAGKTFDELMPDDVAARHHEYLGQVLTSGAGVQFEDSLNDFENNSRVDFETRMVPLSDNLVLAIVRDITEIREAERRLHESMETSADIVDSIPSGLFIYRFEAPDKMYLIDANREAMMLTGLEISKYRGKEFQTIWPGAFNLGITKKFVSVMETGKTFISESLEYNDDRMSGSFRLRAFRMPGNKLGIAFENITERTRAYEILRESEERYRFVFKNIPAMLMSTDAEGRLTNVSSFWLNNLGYRRDEVIDQKFAIFLAPESRHQAETIDFPAFFESGSCHDLPYQLMRKNGEIINVLFAAVAKRNTNNEIVHTLAVMVEITDLKKAQQKAHTFVRAVEQSPVHVIILDITGAVIFVNQQYLDATGYAEQDLVGQKLPMLTSRHYDVEFYANIWSTVQADRTWSGTIQDNRKNGELYWSRLSISPVFGDDNEVLNYLCVAEDITNEMMMQQLFVESDKLSAIGLLAAGVAHEFKNYLCGIIGNASMALAMVKTHDDDVQEALSTIVDIGERANGLASSLLTYSKAPTDSFEQLDLRLLVDNTISLIEKELKKLSIDIITHYEDIPHIRVSPGRMQQLLLNLLTNSFQSIGSDGVVAVSLRHEYDLIMLDVSDTGDGIPVEFQSKIFDPFYSTKGVWGEDRAPGIGMGLSICRNIAHEHGGEIQVYSLPRIGSVFRLTLPEEGESSRVETGVMQRRSHLQRNILIYSTDKKLLGHYFKQTCTSDICLYWTDCSDTIRELSEDMIDVLICDCRHLDMKAILEIVQKNSNRLYPLALIHLPLQDEFRAYAADIQVYHSAPSLSMVLDRIQNIKPAMPRLH